ncbi:transglycosylase domain-containing protein [Paenibacillus sp. UNC217MF]|uniref:transglycosylase domain-containing protein n=1 Tax=Paenibacillus sp. UNC217MF TaxID=1449062 RepID=UPI000566AB20|nr:transglycosylase domain-containing protein [Paenibacillus sp. UNC217MF]
MKKQRKGHLVQASVFMPLPAQETIAHRKVPSASQDEPHRPTKKETTMIHEQTETIAQPAHTPHRMKWKRWVIYSLIIAILTPIIGWVGMAATGTAWIDQGKLITFREQIAQEATTAKGQHLVQLEHMASFIPQELMAIEDHRFKLHPGIDPIGLARSVWINVTKQQKAQGGSTITMQLARNLFLTHDKTFSRKMKEMAIAANLEWNFSKQEILEMYLNKVYFGHGQYGIENAARYYFGKTTRVNGDLPTVNKAEAAILVGLLKAPERYSPSKNMKLALQRQHVVLKRMKDLGWMTEAERQAALKTPIGVVVHSKGK